MARRAKSFLSILALGVHPNDAITVTADGPDHEQALAGLNNHNFGE